MFSLTVEDILQQEVLEVTYCRFPWTVQQTLRCDGRFVLRCTNKWHLPKRAAKERVVRELASGDKKSVPALNCCPQKNNSHERLSARQVLSLQVNSAPIPTCDLMHLPSLSCIQYLASVAR
jgi:hypothetical protein